METTKTAKEYLDDQYFGFDQFTKLTNTGISPDYDAIAEFADDYSNHVNTSQKQTIERLREGLKELVSIVKIHSKATKNNFAWAELEEAEQLLSTTEPIGDKQP